jgi:hypothetical protein
MTNRVPGTTNRIMAAAGILWLLFSFSLYAGGGSEAPDDFVGLRGEIFEDIADQLARQTMTALQAREEFSELRKEFGRPYSDESGILDAILDGMADGDISAVEGRRFFAMLQDGLLMEYRIARQRERNALLVQEMLREMEIRTAVSVDGEPSGEELRGYLGNFYRIMGMSYDESYQQISSLIDRYEDGSLDISALEGEFRRIRRRVAQEAQGPEGGSTSPAEETADAGSGVPRSDDPPGGDSSGGGTPDKNPGN